MSYSHIRFEALEDGIAVLTIHRPEKLNALNRDTIGELGEVFQAVEKDPAVRGLIITGAGEKAFVAGADIRELAAGSPLELRRQALQGQRVFRSLEEMAKPSVAAINGFALGGGLELAMSCTFRVAVPGAKLGQPEVKLGLIPGYGGTQRLPRLVGRGAALELLLTGDPIDATEGHRIGLVNHLVPSEELIPFSKHLLHKIAAVGPVAVALVMEAVDTGLQLGLEEGLRFEATAFGLAAATEDRREGTAAFLEKRKAQFAGK
jgi:enoyl-CoA hydratase